MFSWTGSRSSIHNVFAFSSSFCLLFQVLRFSRSRLNFSLELRRAHFNAFHCFDVQRVLNANSGNFHPSRPFSFSFPFEWTAMQSEISRVEKLAMHLILETISPPFFVSSGRKHLGNNEKFSFLLNFFDGWKWNFKYFPLKNSFSVFNYKMAAAYFPAAIFLSVYSSYFACMS